MTLIKDDRMVDAAHTWYGTKMYPRRQRKAGRAYPRVREKMVSACVPSSTASPERQGRQRRPQATTLVPGRKKERESERQRERETRRDREGDHERGGRERAVYIYI